MRPIPEHLRAPLRPDERMAEQYADRPGRLIELALETGNRGLFALAVQIRLANRRRERERRRSGQGT